MQHLNKLLPCGFKDGMRNWVNFHYTTQKSEKLYFDRLFLSKAYASARKLQRNYMSWHWRVIQNLKENCSWLEKSHKKFGYFHASSQKPENLLFHWLLSSKAYKVLDEKVQESYISRHEKVVQSLKKIWLLVPKLTWGIW